MLANRQQIQQMITQGELLEAQPWDLYINGNGKDKMLNIGLRVYLESFHDESIYAYIVNPVHHHEAIEEVTMKLYSWIEHKKVWIHKDDREITIRNTKEYQKVQKKQDKIEKSGTYKGELKPSII